MSPTIRALALGAGAAAALLPAIGSAQDTSIDRLFHTPQQRAELDKRRNTPQPVAKDEPAAPPPREALVTVNGYVGRSSGKTTTWVNGVPQYDAVRAGDPTRVPVEAADGTRRVKVGATLDTNRGDVRDVIGDGRIQVNSAPAKP
jgi:hypothetical protein